MDERPEACPACRGTVLIRSGHACPAALEVQGPERLERCGVRLFCTDDAPYDEALPVGRHDIGKDQTQHSESNNSRQRHWFARFRRRTCVVFRSVEMVDATMALFAFITATAAASRQR